MVAILFRTLDALRIYDLLQYEDEAYAKRYLERVRAVYLEGNGEISVIGASKG